MNPSWHLSGTYTFGLLKGQVTDSSLGSALPLFWGSWSCRGEKIWSQQRHIVLSLGLFTPRRGMGTVTVRVSEGMSIFDSYFWILLIYCVCMILNRKRSCTCFERGEKRKLISFLVYAFCMWKCFVNYRALLIIVVEMKQMQGTSAQELHQTAYSWV